VNVYDREPFCQKCGAPVWHAEAACLCGGWSQYHRRSWPGIGQETARELIPAEETRSGGMDWYEAFCALMDRYVPPE
jgi:hypothetical protein